MTLLPARSAVDRGDVESSVLNLDDGPDQVFSVLRSDTAREILTALYDEPTVASKLADRVDTSPQNVQYHLDNLVEADLVTVADTWYSAKGKEMKVYAPANEPLVVVIGDSEDEGACRRALAQVTGAGDGR